MQVGPKLSLSTGVVLFSPIVASMIWIGRPQIYLLSAENKIGVKHRYVPGPLSAANVQWSGSPR